MGKLKYLLTYSIDKRISPLKLGIEWCGDSMILMKKSLLKPFFGNNSKLEIGFTNSELDIVYNLNPKYSEHWFIWKSPFFSKNADLPIPKSKKRNNDPFFDVLFKINRNDDDNLFLKEQIDFLNSQGIDIKSMTVEKKWETLISLQNEENASQFIQWLETNVDQTGPLTIDGLPEDCQEKYSSFSFNRRCIIHACPQNERENKIREMYKALHPPSLSQPESEQSSQVDSPTPEQQSDGESIPRYMEAFLDELQQEIHPQPTSSSSFFHPQPHIQSASPFSFQ